MTTRRIFYSFSILLIVLIVGRNFYQALQTINFKDLLLLDPLYLVLSLLSYLIFITFLGFGWIVIQHQGNPLKHLSDLPAYYITSMGKYIPGKIWTALSKEHFFPKEKKTKAVGSGFLEIIATVVSGLLVSSFTIFNFLNLPPITWLVLIILLLSLIIFLPNIFTYLITQFEKKLLKRESGVNFGNRWFVMAIFIDTGAWVIGGLSLFFLLTAFNPEPLSQIPKTISIFAASYTIGYIAFFLPGGIGVREQVFAVLLGSNPNSYLAALLIRLISLVGDGALAVIGILSRRRKESINLI